MAKREFTPLIDVEAEPLLESHKDVRLKYCETSDKVYLNKRWVKYNPDIIARLIKESLVFQKFTEITAIEVELSDDPLTEFEATVFVSAKKENIDIHQEYPITYKIIREESPMVSKEKSGQYYQGVFQLIEGTTQARNKVDELIAAAHKKGIFMNKKVETPAQCDYYLSNNNFLLQLAKKMQKLYGGTLNHTSTLHTFDHLTSKELHRGTVTLFCFKFTKNAMLEKAGDIFLVEAVQKEAKLINIATQEKMSVNAKDAREYTVLAKQPITICQRQPNVTGLHPESFQEEVITVLDGSTIPNKSIIKGYVIGDALFYTE